MPLVLVQSEPHILQADAFVQTEPSIFPQFDLCFGQPVSQWPDIRQENQEINASHPIFSRKKFPKNPYLGFKMCPLGQSVWELSPRREQFILIHTALAHPQKEWKWELSTLAKCYRSSMQLTASLGCHSVIIPFSCENSPTDTNIDCLEYTVTAIGQTLLRLDASVWVWLAVDKNFKTSLHPDLADKIQHYIEKVNPSLEKDTSPSEYYQLENISSLPFSDSLVLVKEDNSFKKFYQAESLSPEEKQRLQQELDTARDRETFQQMLFHFIDQKNLKDPDVYKRANLDRRLFSKIRSHVDYHPSKNTVLALAVALELTLDETQILLETAGFTLSHALRQDIIIEFFIREKIYNIFQINEMLFYYSLPLLGITENGFRSLHDSSCSAF